MIQCVDVARSFVSPAETVAALDGISLHVPRGAFYVLRGPSGCGKTTLLNIVAGLDSADSGSVIVRGQRISDLSPSLRSSFRLHNIGVVFQDHNLIGEFTCLDNVLLPLELMVPRLADPRHEAELALTKMGVGGLAHRLPGDVSGGQRQRVGIARALAGAKALLLADEPTGSLDSVNSRALFQLIRDLCDAGLTALVASHDPEIESYADTTVRMRDGRFE